MTTTLAVGGNTARSPTVVPPPRAPNRIAQRLTGRPYLSHSQLSLMRSCPRRFAFQYIEQVPKDFLPSSLVFGGSIHSALELFFRCQLEGLGVTRPAMLSAYHDAWRRQCAEAGSAVPVRFNKTEDIDKLHALADRMIGAFLASPLCQPKGTIVGIEEELRVVLDPQLPDLLAKVDLVTQTDGSLHIIDFKTSRSSWNEQKAEESADQLVLYGMTLGKMSRSLGLPVKLHFAVLTKHKAPRVQLLPVPNDEQRITVLRESVAQVWQAIQSGNFYPSPSPQQCTICPFRSRCPVFAHSGERK
jgi:CRISPR/Cas system-associated exonuclease Cas4 (RecB family)